MTDHLSESEYVKKIPLPSKVQLANQTPGDSVDCSEESLEWLTKSLEYESWISKEACAFLWLHGIPGDGKTVAATYVLKKLLLPHGYAKNWDVASIFCSRGDSEIGLVASLAFQLIRKKDRAQAVEEKIPITKFHQDQVDEEVLTHELWILLEALIVAVPGYETVFIIDGIDELGSSTRSSFLKSFCFLEKRIQPNAIIRVLISSRAYPDIKDALAHYSSIERGKEWKGRELQSQ
jgi:Cdc6-like AAA superfamily ATPase